MADSDAQSAAVESAPASNQTEESTSTIPARNVTAHVQGALQSSSSDQYEFVERTNLRVAGEHYDRADIVEGFREFVEELKQQSDRVRDFTSKLSLSELSILLVWTFCVLLCRLCRICCRIIDGVLGDRLERYAEWDVDEFSWLYYASPELARKFIHFRMHAD